MIPFLRKSIQILTVLGMAALVGACSSDDESPSRPFRMGFAPYPYQISAESNDYLSGKLAVEADIINHRFDSGIPWEAALLNQTLPESLLSDWAARKNLAEAGHKVFVSVTPLNTARNGLAAWRGERENMPLPAPWNSLALNDEKVKTAYLNYCKRLIDYFNPDYFAISIEVNLLYRNNPQAWPAYLELHEYIYKELKRHYPGLPVFSSLAGTLLIKGLIAENDHVVQRLAAMQVLQHSDRYAVSFYPMMHNSESPMLPENVLDELFSLSTKPIIVAETAYTAERVALPSKDGALIFDADPLRQKMFVDALLKASDRWRAEFVIWLTLRDFDDATAEGAEAYATLRENTGFYDEAGNPRPALNTWRDYFRRMVEDRRQ